ncbi:LysM peptidoglycan-binding domain-containing protein [Cohnella terricola]|uniref:LysM peptidoglycan-binding domain-containing protein n=1 Tax=Cohnella terricola TaxID=1289167 RepID=A0A559JVZ9_9BACL|nr:LysM peptidoglycan-binding domain-containing protein [Cohnella terricola]TVY04048.1 LysM peptidoglycan-binding domain-containing protein [Cohnella terricola]
MTDQLNGLRFDIYERVHLPDDVAAIEELEEIELVPHMQALPQDDQVLLRGHLLLSGIYRSQESSGVSQLEHWIPVEISLPLNRIESVEELAVEIDNFDVDLMTTRSLNVTGVLALRGLQMQSAQSPIWRDDSFTVVHQAMDSEQDDQEDRIHQAQYDADGAIVEKASFSSPALNEQIEQGREDEWGLQQEIDSLTSHESAGESKENGWLSMFQHLEEARADETEDELMPELHEVSVSNDGEIPLWGDLTKERIEESTFLVEPELVQEPDAVSEAVEEIPDVKVALGGKPLESVAAPQQTGVGLLSQLGEKGAKREAELRIQEAALAEEQAKQSGGSSQNSSTGDELEWTRLFLNNGAETNAFKKVRMCIVQREETLDLIADRYHIQPRELQLYNRLQEPYLSEGQVLYIP